MSFNMTSVATAHNWIPATNMLAVITSASCCLIQLDREITRGQRFITGFFDIPEKKKIPIKLFIQVKGD